MVAAVVVVVWVCASFVVGYQIGLMVGYDRGGDKVMDLLAEMQREQENA